MAPSHNAVKEFAAEFVRIRAFWVGPRRSHNFGYVIARCFLASQSLTALPLTPTSHMHIDSEYGDVYLIGSYDKFVSAILDDP